MCMLLRGVRGEGTLRYFLPHYALLPATHCAAACHTLRYFLPHTALLPATPCPTSCHTMRCCLPHNTLLPGTHHALCFLPLCSIHCTALHSSQQHSCHTALLIVADLADAADDALRDPSPDRIGTAHYSKATGLQGAAHSCSCCLRNAKSKPHRHYSATHCPEL